MHDAAVAKCLEWVPYPLVDSQMLNDAIAAPASPLSVTVSNGCVVDLSRWTTTGIATQIGSEQGETFAVQQGAGLTAKALIYARSPCIA